MPTASDIFALGNAAVVAPAWHGMTEVIAQVAALGRRASIILMPTLASTRSALAYSA